jgi:hypothetical protein
MSRWGIPSKKHGVSQSNYTEKHGVCKIIVNFSLRKRTPPYMAKGKQVLLLLLFRSSFVNYFVLLRPEITFRGSFKR